MTSFIPRASSSRPRPQSAHHQKLGRRQNHTSWHAAQGWVHGRWIIHAQSSQVWTAPMLCSNKHACALVIPKPDSCKLPCGLFLCCFAKMWTAALRLHRPVSGVWGKISSSSALQERLSRRLVQRHVPGVLKAGWQGWVCIAATGCTRGRVDIL